VRVCVRVRRGTTNAFQIATESSVAYVYNDKSVLENMHVSTAFQLLQKPEMNFLKGLSKEQKSSFRETVIAMVLATDMAFHFKNLAELRAVIKKKQYDDALSARVRSRLRSLPCTDALLLDPVLLPSPSAFPVRLVRADQGAFELKSAADRLMLLETALHCSDLGNPAKPQGLSLQWTDRVLSEFYNQGDRERKLGLPITPGFDRSKAAVEISQMKFIEFVVAPLYETVVQIVPEAQECLDHINKNHAHWEAQLKAKPPSTPPAGAAPAPAVAPAPSAAPAAASGAAPPTLSVPTGTNVAPAVSLSAGPHGPAALAAALQQAQSK
jgi:hypothetical protein